MKLLNDYLKEEYGCKVYKLSLQLDVTCPVRDGRLDTRGCIFCSAGGSGEFAADRNKSVTEQIVEAKERVSSKAGRDAKYIAYFQSFTGTYGDIGYLEKAYREALACEEIVALSIGTRPDSISEEMYGLLKELNLIKPVWIELGLQTIHPETAKYIRRGYELPVYDECVKRLRSMGITVIVHVILGLPGESIEDMKGTVRYVCGSGIQGIKLQLLHVLKGTDLYDDYKKGLFDVMSMEEYLELLRQILPLIPDSVVIHRLTGDGPKRILEAPLWTADKKKVMNEIGRIIKETMEPVKKI
ncbi:MAG: TIGR01212 family radical SAM protein [Lachnospiraceae bacterium]|nr:TIGR01212 family radical SAM protein [Lachnospiraceae bacterium]